MLTLYRKLEKEIEACAEQETMVICRVPAIEDSGLFNLEISQNRQQFARCEKTVYCTFQPLVVASVEVRWTISSRPLLLLIHSFSQPKYVLAGRPVTLTLQGNFVDIGSVRVCFQAHVAEGERELRGKTRHVVNGRLRGAGVIVCQTPSLLANRYFAAAATLKSLSN